MKSSISTLGLLYTLLGVENSLAFRSLNLDNIRLTPRSIVFRNRLFVGISACASDSDRVLKPAILAPAQFGVPNDYRELVSLMEHRGFRLFVAPLSRLDW